MNWGTLQPTQTTNTWTTIYSCLLSHEVNILLRCMPHSCTWNSRNFRVRAIIYIHENTWLLRSASGPEKTTRLIDYEFVHFRQSSIAVCCNWMVGDSPNPTKNLYTLPTLQKTREAPSRRFRSHFYKKLHFGNLTYTHQAVSLLAKVGPPGWICLHRKGTHYD